jgi:hypothetical protein
MRATSRHDAPPRGVREVRYGVRSIRRPRKPRSALTTATVFAVALAVGKPGLSLSVASRRATVMAPRMERRGSPALAARCLCRGVRLSVLGATMIRLAGLRRGPGQPISLLTAKEGLRTALGVFPRQDVVWASLAVALPKTSATVPIPSH